MPIVHCSLCQGEIGDECHVIENQIVCSDCLTEYTCYADPVAVCAHCGEVISDEAFFVLYHKNGEVYICEECLPAFRHSLPLSDRKEDQ